MPSTFIQSNQLKAKIVILSAAGVAGQNVIKQNYPSYILLHHFDMFSSISFYNILKYQIQKNMNKQKLNDFIVLIKTNLQ